MEGSLWGAVPEENNKSEHGCRMTYAGFPYFSFGVRGRSYFNYLASIVRLKGLEVLLPCYLKLLNIIHITVSVIIGTMMNMITTTIITTLAGLACGES